ncbi:MAG: hypothetical protein WD270_09905 [Acetobacterales bacterium]
MSEQGIAVILLAFLIWLVIRRAGQKRREREAAESGGGPQGGTPSPKRSRKQREMPRVGQPGSITDAQIDRLKANGFEPARTWSFEEAALVLDATDYLRAAILKATGDDEPPVEVQNVLLQFILSDDDLRNYVRAWGERRREEGREREAPKLRANNQFRRVEQMIDELWEDREEAAPRD